MTTLIKKQLIRFPLTLAIAIQVENIIGAIQCTCGGPKLVQAKPNRPIVSSGAACVRQLEYSLYIEWIAWTILTE